MVNRLTSFTALMLASAAFIACDADPPEPEGFISDDPTNSGTDDANGDDGAVGPGAGSGGGFSDGGGNGGGGGAPPTAPEGEEDPERLIEEADIIQFDGDKLYALSQFSGLSILDISNPANIEILGRKKLGGEPFEMYRRDDLVYAMFRSWGRYEQDEDGNWAWITSSHVEVIDVSTPNSLQTVGTFEVPGYLSDSRFVGDILYTVSIEDGYCWGCDSSANTTVTSLSAADPQNIGIVDQLSLVESSGYSWQRSLHVTDERIYIGGPEWDSNGSAGGSTIEVVDITDASGALGVGDTVPIDGQINNRWQMDEHEGVLRVISQPWDSSVNPKVETFTVVSSTQIEPLGQTQLVLPEPESLRSVRFDGERAYAITAMQMDPLFTVDLSDPANPAQRGELEMPGWVYHLEPRGDRVLALGFDNQSNEGSLHVSLFDVSDMNQPTMIERIHFGGDWGEFAEDQDRIHKAFKVLPDLGLLLVPFSAWNWDEGGCGGYDSGIQLVDWAEDTLVKRGVAPVRGDARRAFLHEDTLFALSDEQLRAYDFSDRDAPTKVGEHQLSTHVSKTVVVGDSLVRLAADWWTSEPRLEVVPVSDPGAAQPVGALDLGAMLAEVEQDDSCYGWSYWDVRLFATGNTVVMVWPSWDWESPSARVATVDVSDPSAPTLLAHVDVPVDAYSYSGWYYGYGQLVAAGDTMALLGDQLLLTQVNWSTDEYGYGYPGLNDLHGGEIRVLDLSNPSAPALSTAADLPVGLGHTGFQVHGDTAYFGHWTPVEDAAGKVRFYVDRVRAIDGEPVVLPSINVPGSLLKIDAESGHALTVDYTRHTEQTTAEDCYQQYGNDVWFEYDDENFWDSEDFDYQTALGTCVRMDRTLKVAALDEENATATLLDTSDIQLRGWVDGLQGGDDRMFFVANSYTFDDDDYVSETNVYVIGGIRAGELEVVTAPLGDAWWAYPVGAFDKTLVAASSPGAIVTVDATDLDDLVIEQKGEMPWWIESVTFHDETALVSLGPWGLTAIDL